MTVHSKKASFSKKDRRFLYFIIKDIIKFRWVEFGAIFVSIFICSASWIYFFKQETSKIVQRIDGMILLTDLQPLGKMNVSMYSHLETKNKNLYTASGYKLNPSVDSRKVCAVSRELYNKTIFNGDILYVKVLNEFYTVVDTMADIHPSTNRPQRNWVDIYESDLEQVDAFGRQTLEVFKLKR